MCRAAFWSGYGRGACGGIAAACIGLAVSGCSSGVSRFDFPAFNLTGSTASADAGSGDVSSTAALPPVLPEESVYSSGDASNAQMTHASLPPPTYSPRPSAAAAYSPAAAPAQAAPQPKALHADVTGPRVAVAKGDTLSTLSRRYGVPVEAIIAANNLPDGHLSVGQELVIPGAKTPKAAETADASGQPTYKVEKGDTPHIIAEKLGVDEKALIARNNLKPSNLRIGQVLAVPSKSAKPVVAAKDDTPLTEPAVDTAPEVRKVKTTTIPAPGTSLAEDEAGPSAPGAKSRGKSGSTPNEVAASPEITGEEHARTRTDQLPAPDPMSGNSFRWPVKGRVIAEFGTRPDGGHNDGIDVAVPQGTSV